MTQSKHRNLFDGVAGDSLFWKPLLLFFSENELPSLYEKINAPEDHRLLAVITALVIENRIDKINSLFMPKYSRLLEASGFSFSMKISLLEALNFIPVRITSVAHCFRKIRNEFAHNLDILLLDDIDEKLIQPMVSHYEEAFRGFGSKSAKDVSSLEVFKKLSFFCISGLDSYTPNVKFLRAELSKEDFLSNLNKFVQETNWDNYREIVSHPPASVERQGDTLIKRYEGGVVEIASMSDE